MHIYFKAPLINSDLYITHLCEHLLSEYLGTKDFYNYRNDLNAVSYPGYCVFDLPERINKEEIINILENAKKFKIDEFIKEEQKVIEEELENPEYEHKLYEAVINKIAEPINYKHNTKKLKIDAEVLKRYFNNLIKNDNYIITDNKFNIQYGKIKKETISKNFQYQIKDITFKKNKYKIYSFSGIKNENIGKIITSFEILNAYNKKSQRIDRRKYFYLTPNYYLFQPNKKIIFLIPKIKSNIKEDFFNLGKEFTIKLIKSGEYDENLKILYPYFMKIECNKKKIIESIKKFNYSEFKEIFL